MSAVTSQSRHTTQAVFRSAHLQTAAVAAGVSQLLQLVLKVYTPNTSRPRLHNSLGRTPRLGMWLGFTSLLSDCSCRLCQVPQSLSCTTKPRFDGLAKMLLGPLRFSDAKVKARRIEHDVPMRVAREVSRLPSQLRVKSCTNAALNVKVLVAPHVTTQDLQQIPAAECSSHEQFASKPHYQNALSCLKKNLRQYFHLEHDSLHDGVHVPSLQRRTI